MATDRGQAKAAAPMKPMLEDTPTEVPIVSVIIVTYNNAAIIQRCLESAKRAAAASTNEILLIDNGSTDGTVELTQRFDSDIRIVALESNQGFAQANNVGMSLAKGRFIALVNSDAFPDPGSIDRLRYTIEQDRRIGIVGARLRYGSGALQPSAARFPSLLGNLWLALFLHRAPVISRVPVAVLAHRTFYQNTRTVDAVYASFCLARREVGPLPTSSFMYGEDVQWCHQAQRRGLRVVVEPAATGVHLAGSSVRSSQAAGFAQTRRVATQLQWFEGRGLAAQLLARMTLATHALVRLGVYGAASAIGLHSARPQLQDACVLLRSSLSPRHRLIPPSSNSPGASP